MGLGNEAEQLLEEKTKLENEYRVAQLHLSDDIVLNNESQIENIAKDGRIADLERVLEDFKQVHPLELDMLRNERSCVVQSYDHEVETSRIINARMELQLQRMEELQKAADILKEDIEKNRNQEHNLILQHVDALHSLNVELFQKRKIFEEQYRTAINRAHAFHAEKALLMLSEENSKLLKQRALLLQELEIQQRGIESLQSRIGSEKKKLRETTLNREKWSAMAEELRHELVALREPVDGTGETISAVSLLAKSPFEDWLAEDSHMLMWEKRLKGIAELKALLAGEVDLVLESPLDSNANFKALAKEDKSFYAASIPIFTELDVSLLPSTPCSSQQAVIWTAHKVK